MNRWLPLLAIIFLPCYCRAKSCAEIFIGEAKSKSFNIEKLNSTATTLLNCLGEELKSNPNDLQTNEAFILASYIFGSWADSKAYEAYFNAVKNGLGLDSFTKRVSLECFVRGFSAYGHRNKDSKVDSQTIVFINLANELLEKDTSVVCLRKRIYERLADSFEYINDEMFKQYNTLFAEDKKHCKSKL